MLHYPSPKPRQLSSTTHHPSPFTRRDYVHASWCYINGHLTLKDISDTGDLRSALYDLDKYFSNTKHAGKLFASLCEKAALLSVIRTDYSLNNQDIWLSLMSKEIGFERLNISGRKIRILKHDNPEILLPVHITSRYLLQFLKGPSFDLINKCGEELQAADAAQWMGFFFNALRYRPAIEY